MASQDCPPVLPIDSDSQGDEEQTSQDQQDVGEETQEPTARQRAVGKMKTVINSGLYQRIPAERSRVGLTPFAHMTDAYLRETGIEWQNFRTSVEDRFRYEAGSHWGIWDVLGQDDRGVEEGTFRYLDRGAFKRDNRDEFAFGVAFKVKTLSEPVQDERFSTQNVTFLRDFYKKEALNIVPRTSQFGRLVNRQTEFVKSYWDAWVRGGTQAKGADWGGESVTFPPLWDTSREYSDHAFRITAPMFPREVKKINNLTKPAIAKVDMEYNFYVSVYESAMARALATGESIETLLPNLYVFLLEKKSKNLDSDRSIYHQHITLGGLINKVSVDVLNQDGEKIGEKDEGQYFDKWGRMYDRLLSSSQHLAAVQNKFKRIIISPSDIEVLNSYNEKRFLFPMHVDLQFSTDRTTLLAEAIKEAQLSTSLIKAAMHAPIDPNDLENVDTPGYVPRLSNFRIATETIFSGARADKSISLSRSQRRVVLDIVEWWKAFKERELEYDGALRQSVTLGSSLPEVFVSEDEQFRFVQTILSLIFSGKLRNILKGRLRSFEDIMNGKHAYSETAFYKISKRLIKSDGGTGAFVQDIFIPNSSDLDVFRYIDTQVIFNKQYRYIVYAYELVFGTAYQYSPNPAFTAGPFTGPPRQAAVVDVYTRPSIQLVEVPVFSFDTKISDKPPLPPQVDLVPFRAVSDEILINLNVDTGELKAQPIVLSVEEAHQINQTRLLHDLDPGDPIEYKGDDPIQFFEVFRLAKKPRSYNDFIGEIHLQINTDLNADAGHDFEADLPTARTSSASVIDRIRPNVKYYYTFRAVDIHGNTSNPSAVYKVEMVEQEGMIFPIIEVLNFEPEKNKDNSKSFKRYIHIAASVMQTELNITNEDLIESAADAEVELGIVEEKLFAKHPQTQKIKVRMTSKQTGKKIDINLSFAHKHNP